MANYSKLSPWRNTETYSDYLSFLRVRTVSAEPDDFFYKIEPQYMYRPDLLSFDLYGTPKLWWVFMQRNIDVMQDPIFDFKPGLSIYIPKKSSLFSSLGI